MSPSIYLGCAIEDATADALREVNKSFLEIEQEADTILASLQSTFNQLTGTKTTAKVEIGNTTANKVMWEAVESGSGGNNISVTYLYKGPDFFAGAFQPRLPSAEAIGKTIYVTLAVDVNGNIDPLYNINALLPIWLSGTGVSDLVTAYATGTGTGLPTAQPLTPLSGGAGTPLKDAEDAANGIAKQFGHNSYQSLLKAIDVPVVESVADAAKYLESVDDKIVIINKKLFIVEGTNLVGIRLLYNTLGQDIKKMREFLIKMAATKLIPHVFVTQNLENIHYEMVCGVPEPITTITPVWRTYNEGLITTAERYTNKDVSQLSSVVLWAYTANESSQNYTKLSNWGYSDELIDFILDGDTPVLTDFYGPEQIPTVAVIPDPALLTTLKLTDAEIEELLGKDVQGIRVPTATDPEDKGNKIKDLLKNNRPILPNGMRTKIKKPIALAQAVDMRKTGDAENLSKELAVRGGACARQKRNMSNRKPNKISLGIDAANAVANEYLGGVEKALNALPNYSSPNIPDLNIPNIPTPDLPNFAKKIESAFGALSSVVNTATRTYDRMVNKVLGLASSILNKIQNVLSLADNLLNNDLAKCLLGSGTDATGKPQVPEVGGTGGGGGGGGGIGPISIGGIPIPMSLLKDALTELNETLDAAVTSAVEAVMKLIEKPLCMVQSMLDDMLGFSLGVDLNPCKKGKDPNNTCDPEEVQTTINESTELGDAYDKLPQSDIFPKTNVQTEITETVENFTGQLKKSVSDVTTEITRGINQVMEDITKSINSSIEVLDKFTKSIKELLGEDLNESAKTIEEEAAQQQGCAPPSIGALTDAISAVI